MSENQPITPVAPAAAPAVQPAATILQTAPAQAPRSESMVPSWRVREETDKRKQFEQQAQTYAQELAAIKAQLEELTPKASRAEELEAALTSYKSTAARRIALARLSSERPALAHDSIQDFLLSGYEKATAGQEEPPDFDAWLTAVEESNDPLYSPHLKRKDGPDPRAAQVSSLFAAVDAGTMTPEQAAEAFMAALQGQGEQQAAPLTPAQQVAALLAQMAGQGTGQPAQVLTGDPNAGARTPAAPVKTYTTAELARLRSQNGGRLPATVRQALLQNMKQSGAIK